MTWLYKPVHGVLFMMERCGFRLRELAWEARDHGLRFGMRKIASKLGTGLLH
jgi:hypothetical protein